MDATKKEETLNHVATTDKIALVADADLVIEAMIEDFEIKRKMFVELDSEGRYRHGLQTWFGTSC